MTDIQGIQLRGNRQRLTRRLVNEYDRCIPRRDPPERWHSGITGELLVRHTGFGVVAYESNQVIFSRQGTIGRIQMVFGPTIVPPEALDSNLALSIQLHLFWVHEIWENREYWR
ncbi:hypothetical protein BS47DRAFT_1368927 [Hydnum rufescens UP504]|uniref:Uncharacterized protein n=1 Tax=Hydnum rufescens UP504 TaxID=1448309 RepID=A0A9P6AF68_9AGAM|nr:hypothetical protein BS47DRAFT_1368927 [Hydnum rufescens UP504]